MKVDEQIERQPGETDPDRAAGQRQITLSVTSCRSSRAAPGAEGGAQRHLAAATDGARQRQIGDVRARDQQHQHRRAGDREQHRPRVADQLLLERLRPPGEFLARW